MAIDKSMQVLILLAIAALCASSPAYTKDSAGGVKGRSEGDKSLAIVPRDEWGARPPKDTTNMSHPVPYVIIHHSYIPAACHTDKECEEAMRSMQIMHQDTNNWADIGYNFLIGGNKRIYMGRGWDYVGAHAPSYNNVSIGICFIGDWTSEIPPSGMLDLGHALITYGVDNGYIRNDYELFGHRQVRDTECPGDAFFKHVQQWPHWGSKPPRYFRPQKTTNSPKEG